MKATPGTFALPADQYERLTEELGRILGMVQVAVDRAIDQLAEDDPMTPFLAVLEQHTREAQRIARGAKRKTG